VSTTVLLFIPLIATVAQRFEAGRASAGDKVGARLISDAALTAGAEFWAAMPMATAARDDFAIVSASLWLHGDWGGVESVIAARIFADHCGGEGGGEAAPVMLDVGAHVGYFTLLARAHGCRTRSVEMNPSYLEKLRLSMFLNDFAHRTVRIGAEALDRSPSSALINGYVGADPAAAARERDAAESNEPPRAMELELGDLLADDEEDVLYMKLDVEGAEGAALASASARRVLARVRYAYVEVTLADYTDMMVQPTIVGTCAGAVEAMQHLRASGLVLYRLDETESGGWAMSAVDEPGASSSFFQTLCAESIDAKCKAQRGNFDQLKGCCDLFPRACQWDIFAARPPANFDFIGNLSLARRASSGSGGAVHRSHVKIEAVDAIEWEAPEVGDDGLVRMGVEVHMRDHALGVRNLHVSVPATLSSSAQIVEACPRLQLDPGECQQLADEVERTVFRDRN
jgi:FkbM family methyltransferase